jgi:hypothetical protein
MPWTLYIADFFAGAFLTNAVPHFVKGVCGDRFPTPFAKPPGKGLSSATVNVVWALFNMVVGWILLEVGRLPDGNRTSLLVFFLGVIALGIMSSANFSKKHAS